MRNTFPLGAFGICFIIGIFVGCVALQPGTDPLVVRVEQGETLAGSTFNFVVTFDDANRAFWLTNAPAFHNFAEWLRTPVPCGTNTIQRGICMILQVDAAKVAYEADKSSSNALLTAFAVLTQATAQSQAWNVIVKQKTP